jgi:hypothetical protein
LLHFIPIFVLVDALEAGSVCSLSHKERGGVRGYGLSIGIEPPHPNPLPDGERERTEIAAWLAIHSQAVGLRELSLI